MKIVSYKSFGSINFEMTEDEVIQQLGKPSYIHTNYNKELQYTYDECSICFDANRLVSYADIYPKKYGELQINDLMLNWQDDFYIKLCLEDGDPYEGLGILTLFNLGIGITGYHDNDDSQKCIGVFNKGYFDNKEIKDTPLKISTIKTINKRKLYLKNIFPYLEDLSVLAQIGGVKADTLTSIEEAAEIRAATGHLNKLAVKNFEIVSSERKSHRFSDYIKNLFAANSNQVYIWAPQTEFCGTYKFDNIQTINLSYFGCFDDNTIWEFITADFKDRIILKFSNEIEDDMLEVETQGLNWPSVKY